jgi:hypothetical protein
VACAFEIDMEYRLDCGSELKSIAAILEQPAIEKIIMHLGLQAGRRRSLQPVGRKLQAA